jgi:cullin 1
MVTTCFKTRYTLQVSTFQMAVLLQYNDSDSLTLQQLQDNTKIREDILRQVVGILVRSKLLECSDDEEQLTSVSTISLFMGYKKYVVLFSV